jgi:prophage regulatory protein
MIVHSEFGGFYAVFEGPKNYLSFHQSSEGSMQQQDLDTLLNRKQVAKQTGLSPATIDRMRKAGAFPRPLQISPRRVAWPAGSIHEWLGSREHAG